VPWRGELYTWTRSRARRAAGGGRRAPRYYIQYGIVVEL
jgi:hypothetical protein